jgi:hypothetical protein
MVTRHRHRCRGRHYLFPGGRAKQQFFDYTRNGHFLACRGHFFGPPHLALVHCAMVRPGRRGDRHRRSQSFAAFWRCDHSHLGRGERSRAAHHRRTDAVLLWRQFQNRSALLCAWAVCSGNRWGCRRVHMVDVCILLAICEPGRTDRDLAALDSV